MELNLGNYWGGMITPHKKLCDNDLLSLTSDFDESFRLSNQMAYKIQPHQHSWANMSVAFITSVKFTPGETDLASVIDSVIRKLFFCPGGTDDCDS